MASTVFQVVGRFRADTKQFANSMATASNSMKSFGTTAEAVSAKSQRVGAAMTRFLSVPLLAIGGAAAAASIEFESAFVGVRKTVDATEAEFERLEKSIREMSHEIPVGASELARIGEIAGQLGIEAQGLDKFIKVVADLGQTTTLNVEEGAFALARISNVMGVATDDSDRLGSTIVDLGNNFAATENEITRMAERIVGAAKVANISTSDVLAFSTALSAVGLRAEAGGSSISRLFIQMQGAVREGGEELARYADVANTSASEFADAFANEPIEAVLQFIEGLEQMRQAGGDVFSTLEDLQLSEIRVRDTLLRAAGAGDLVRRAVETGSEAWDENIALTEEANKRYASTESQLRMVWNQVVDAARAFGDVLAPVLLDVAQAVGPVVVRFFEWVEGFNDLNPAMRKLVIGIAALAVAAGPLLFVFGKAIQLVIGLKASFGTLTTVGLNTAVAIESIATALGVGMFAATGIAIAAVGALVAALYGINRWWTSADRAFEGANEAAASLAESTGLSVRAMEEMSRQDGAVDTMLDFAKANQAAIEQLKDLEDAAARQYLIDIGIALVASGAGSPDEVLQSVERLADAAGIEIEVPITAEDISLSNLEQTVVAGADRIANRMRETLTYDFTQLFPSQAKEMATDLATTIAQSMHSGAEGFQAAVTSMQAFENQLEANGLLAGEVDDVMNFLVDEVAKVGEFSALSAGEVEDLGTMLRAMGDAGYITDQEMQNLLMTTGNMRFSTSQYVNNLMELERMQGENATAADEHGDSQTSLTDDIEAATQAVDEQIRALKALSDPVFAYMDAENQLKEAIAARQEALNTSAEDMGGAEAKAAALARTEQELFEAIINVGAEHARAKATLEQNGDAAAALENKISSLSEQFGVNLDQLGLTDDALNDVIDIINEMPANVELNFDTPGLTQVFNDMGELQRIIGTINGQQINIGIGTGAAGSMQHSGGYAGTGPMRKFSNLRNDEVPAILQKGEFVLSREMVRGFSRAFAVMHDGGYVVKSGDTLSGIAAKVMGDAGAWRKLYEANKGKIKDPNLIFPGQNLVVPHSHGSNTGGSGGSGGGTTGVFPSGFSMDKFNELTSLSGDSSVMQQNVDAAREMVEQMERFQQEFDRAQQRQDLVQNIQRIRKELQGAEKDDVEGLQQRLADANKRLVEFDRQTKRINTELQMQKKIEEQLAKIEQQRAREQLRMEIAQNKQQIRFDNMTREQQIKNLTKRMGGHQKYTDEWTQLYNQRKSLMEQERAEAERMKEVFTDLAGVIGNRFARALRRVADSDQEFEDLAQRAKQFQSAWEGAINGFAGLVSNFADKEFVRFESVVKAFQRRISETADFQQNLVKLADMGLDSDIISQLAAAGPSAAPLVQALLGGDVGIINALQSQLEALGTEGAGEIFSSMLGAPAMPPKVDFTVMMDGEQIARIVGQYLAEEITVHTGVS